MTYSKTLETSNQYTQLGLNHSTHINYDTGPEQTQHPSTLEQPKPKDRQVQNHYLESWYPTMLSTLTSP